MTARKLDLCWHCADTLKQGYTLKRVSGGADNKITCAHCGRRRYGYTYEAVKKQS